MQKHWWKALAGILLMYTLLAGMLVPLKPGIETVEPSSAKAGDLIVLRVQGYNTAFTQAGDGIRAWLKLSNEMALPANQVLVRNDRVARVSFSLPDRFPVDGERQVLSLVMDDAINGAMVSPSALFVSNCAPGGDASRWTRNPIESLHELDDFRFPFRAILYETIRNTYYHVPMWFGMILLFFTSAWYSIVYMRRNDQHADMRAAALNMTGAVFGILGILTGMFWSNYTWGSPWSWDVKQITAAVTLLIYFAYFILRASFEDPERKARISAVYNVFACAMIIPLLFVIPRQVDSLHPGSGGNPAMGGEDLDNTMRMIFYPAVIGWTLFGLWVSQILFRIKRLRERLVY